MTEGEKAVDRAIDQAGTQTMLGVLAMVGGTLLTPVCPVVGPAIVTAGYSYSVGSAAAGGGLAIGKRIGKALRD